MFDVFYCLGLSSEDLMLSDKLDINDIVTNDQPLLKHNDSFRMITIASRGMVHPYRRIHSPMFDETSSEETIQSVLQDNDRVFYRKTYSGLQTKPSSDTVLKADDIEYETFTVNQMPVIMIQRHPHYHSIILVEV